MKPEQVNKVKAYVGVHLDEDLHSRHYDDCVQYILLRQWENHLKGSMHVKIHYILADYYRENGLGKRANVGSVALELAYAHENPYLKRRSPADNEVWDTGHGFTNERYLDEIFNEVQSVLERSRSTTVAIVKEELKKYRYTVSCDYCPEMPELVFKAFTSNERAVHSCPDCKKDIILKERYPYEGYERPRHKK